MKNYIHTLILLFIISCPVFGQAPNWSVAENNFQYTMTFVGFLNTDGNRLMSTNDQVAAFVNGQCRGVTKLIYVPSENKYYAYLTVFSNISNETVSFKIYDSTQNLIKDVVKTISFTTNQHYGNLFQAYPFANIALSSSSDITDIDFKGITKNNIVINGSQITISLSKGQDLKALNANFVLSTGATVYIGSEKQVSGSNTLDFTNPIVFNVLSEDQSQIKQWTVVVKTPSGIGTYYKKDAICYEGGAIKVLYPIENEVVALSRGGIAINSLPITNGQALFINLNAGVYKVSVGQDFKEITIGQKK